MSRTYADVVEFNKEIIKLEPTEYLNDERLTWFKTVINEELSEFEEANKKYKEALESKHIPDSDALLDLNVDMVDAIMDLLYFALGRLYEIGVTQDEFDIMWDALQYANMSKKRGNKGRGSDDDAIKPEGWKGPEETLIEYRKQLQKQLDNCVETSTHVNEHTEKIRTMTPQELQYEHVTNNIYYEHKPGMKYDDGKPNLSLVFGGFSRALVDVAQVGTFGARKYAPEGWKYVYNLQERYSSALLRHMFAALTNDEFDNETGRHHLAHVAWNALALLEDKFNSGHVPYTEYNKEASVKSEETLKKYFEEN